MDRALACRHYAENSCGTYGVWVKHLWPFFVLSPSLVFFADSHLTSRHFARPDDLYPLSPPLLCLLVCADEAQIKLGGVEEAPAAALRDREQYAPYYAADRHCRARYADSGALGGAKGCEHRFL